MSNNHITPFGLQRFITTSHNIVSANFSGCPIDTNPVQYLLDIVHNIYQSPLISCTVNNENIFAQKEQDTTGIMNVLYKMLNSFDLNSAQEREALIKFVSSPQAQKALKWLSQNSDELDLKVVGEQFVFLLNRMANENMFYIKGVCKEFNEEAFFFGLPNDMLFSILSYLNLKDILPTPGPVVLEDDIIDLQDILLSNTGPVIEEVDVLGNSSSTNLFQSTDGDDDLYS